LRGPRTKKNKQQGGGKEELGCGTLKAKEKKKKKKKRKKKKKKKKKQKQSSDKGKRFGSWLV